MTVLVTGAAGFIGVRVAKELRDRGHDVVGVDLMLPQAHGQQPRPPEVRLADIRDKRAVVALLDGVDVVSHQAAMVGAGVDTSDLPLYASHNDVGTAVLLAAMAERGVARLVLASSMVVYGEGRYACAAHGAQPAAPRRVDDLRRGEFDLGCPHCGEPLGWQPVDEEAALQPRSGYAASKVAQEHYAAAWCLQAPGVAVALRYHNVYGPGMPKDSPYSGVAAIFRSALERGEPPEVFEDGRQMRDFVHVDDVAAANAVAVEAVLNMSVPAFDAVNVCSGTPVSIHDVAAILCGAWSAGLAPRVSGRFRPGDVRHVVASPEKARRVLGFAAMTPPEMGLRRFATEPLRG